CARADYGSSLLPEYFDFW
nr:immunoglobulin heavy chain junction region [Macaca mulatta]MOX64664.1 immunoglobulin heavy chain junction region [Macaca mulatta]